MTRTATGPGHRRWSGRTGVLDQQVDTVVVECDRQISLRGRRVLEHVGQRFLDDAESGEIEIRGQVDRPAVSLVLHLQPAGAQPVEQQTDPGKAERCTTELVIVAPQHADDSAQVSQRVASGGRDRGQRVAGRSRVADSHEPRGAGLDDHHAHTVRNDIMQLTRDPGALFGEQPLGPNAGFVTQFGLGDDQLLNQAFATFDECTGPRGQHRDRYPRRQYGEGRESGSRLDRGAGRECVAEHGTERSPVRLISSAPAHRVAGQHDRRRHERPLGVMAQPLVHNHCSERHDCGEHRHPAAPRDR